MFQKPVGKDKRESPAPSPAGCPIGGTPIRVRPDKGGLVAIVNKVVGQIGIEHAERGQRVVQIAVDDGLFGHG